MKNDFEFIRDKIENENISAPSNLDENFAKELVDSGAVPKNTVVFSKKKNRAKIGISLVACFAILVVSVASFGSLSKSEKVENNAPAPSVLNLDVETFSTYDEIEKKIKSINKNNGNYDEVLGIDGSIGYTMKGDEVTESATESIAHSVTNTQVEGVDEADVVKTDGKYIFKSCFGENVISISEVNGPNVKQVSRVRISSDGHLYVNNFYLTDNKLIAICTNESYDSERCYKQESIVKIYDITDRVHPKELAAYKQSGYSVTSRMVGNYLYLITNYCVEPRCKDDEYVPKTTVNGEYVSVECGSIYAMPNVNSADYVVVSAINVNNEIETSETKAVLGGASEVYCNTEHLYVLGTTFDYNDLDYKTETKIMKFDFSGIKVEPVATGKFEGDVCSQYATNEKDGKFFVATTYRDGYTDNNRLLVFDNDLKLIAKTKDFAKDESIKAVRYLGNYAYVITYVQTDPLFVIDLSNPSNPEIKGEVKIDGFSTSLMPVNNDTLLGVGTSVHDLVEDGTKLALFDVSNPEKPVVLDEMEFVDMYSEARYDIKAITVIDNEHYAIVLDDFSTSYKCVVFSIKDKKLVVEHTFDVSDEYTTRAVYINNYIYVLSNTTSRIVPFEL